MAKMTFNLVYNKNGKLNADKTALVQLRITMSGKHRYVDTGIYLKTSQWDKRNKKVKSHALQHIYNNKLLSIRNGAEEYYNRLLMDKEVVALEKIQNHAYALATGHVKDTPNESNLFIPFLEHRIKEDVHLAEKTISQRKVLLGKIMEYAPDLKFDEVTYTFLSEFYAWLQRQPHYRKTDQTVSLNYCTSLMRILKTIVNEAMRQDLITKNPFNGFRLLTTTKKRAWLTLKEVEAIESLNLSKRRGYIPESHLMFIFGCYTGLRFSDLCGLRTNHFKNVDKGLRLLKTPKKTEKNGVLVDLPLYDLFWGRPQKLIRPILDSKRPGSHIFGPHSPNTFNSSFNDHIRLFTSLCGINKKVTAHSSRHTCAMNLLNLGTPLEVVQKVLGQTDINTTQVYAHMLTETQDRSLEDVFNPKK